jgi:protein-tyrosine phosphatase
MLRAFPGEDEQTERSGGLPRATEIRLGAFFAGVNPAGLSEQDIQWLRRRVITTIVDLRCGGSWRVSRTRSGPARFSIPHCPLVGSASKLPQLEADIGRAYFEAM